jgi:hypothetical protein
MEPSPLLAFLNHNRSHGSPMKEPKNEFLGQYVNHEGMIMNCDHNKASWKETTENTQAMASGSPNADAAQVDGDRKAPEGKIQAKYGEDKKRTLVTS